MRCSAVVAAKEMELPWLVIANHMFDEILAVRERAEQSMRHV